MEFSQQIIWTAIASDSWDVLNITTLDFREAEDIYWVIF